MTKAQKARRKLVATRADGVALRSVPPMEVKMTVTMNQIPRAEKHDIGSAILANLQARETKGPPEPALDAYIVELTDITEALGTQVETRTLADAKRVARLARLEMADDKVDTYYRHIESYVDIEANRKIGEFIVGAKALHHAAFPDGLEHINDPIADENRLCRDALVVLRSAEHGATVQAIELPTVWLARWESALDESDAALEAVNEARTEKHSSVNAGRDAEGEWVELFVRLRRYVASRAKRNDTAKIQEGKTLLAPLLDVLAKMKAQAAGRQTRRKNAESELGGTNEP